jgi:anaerobic magnesium-protoporphyrin IX monomethyl ester cyclase
VRYIRSLTTGVRVITSGRLSAQAQLAFEASDVDAIVVSGDTEAGIATYLRWLEDGEREDWLPKGVTVRATDRWRRPTVPGDFLPASQWKLPDVAEIPYAAYMSMYQRDESKFCGIPHRHELVVPAARGCPIGCSFCDVPVVQGLRDRRLSVDRVVAYIENSFAAHPFEYVAFYAPTFTLDRRWTYDLCEALTARGSRYPWKCATAISHLPLELLDAMAESGCIRVSVGLETLDPLGQEMLPRQKQIELARFHALAARCNELGVELNCFTIAGLPGTTPEGVRRTVEEIRTVAGRVRPTMYGNIDRLQTATTLQDAALFNRQLIHPEDSAGDDLQLYDIVFGHEARPTLIMNAIPRRDAAGSA